MTIYHTRRTGCNKLSSLYGGAIATLLGITPVACDEATGPEPEPEPENKLPTTTIQTNYDPLSGALIRDIKGKDSDGTVVRVVYTRNGTYFAVDGSTVRDSTDAVTGMNTLEAHSIDDDGDEGPAVSHSLKIASEEEGRGYIRDVVNENEYSSKGFKLMNVDKIEIGDKTVPADIVVLRPNGQTALFIYRNAAENIEELREYYSIELGDLFDIKYIGANEEEAIKNLTRAALDSMQ